MSELKTEYLCRLSVDLGEAQAIGSHPHGTRRIVPLVGGRMEGPKIRGMVLPFGADWVNVRQDGVFELDVRATIRTDDSELIYVTYSGIAELSRGYFVVTPRFETGSEKYRWLNNTICVGLGKASKGRVDYEVHQIL